MEEMGRRDTGINNSLKKEVEEWRSRFESEIKKAMEKDTLMKSS